MVSRTSDLPRSLNYLDQTQVPAVGDDDRWLKCAVCNIATVKKEVAIVGRKSDLKCALGGSNLCLGRQSKWPRDWLVPFAERLDGGLKWHGV